MSIPIRKTLLFMMLVFFANILSVDIVIANTLKIKITGIDAELEDNVRQQLTILQKQLASKNNKDEHNNTLNLHAIRRYHRLAEAEIKQAIQPFGFYDPTIKTALKQDNSTQKPSWLATYHIDTGVQTTIGEVTIDVIGDGKNLPLLQEKIQQWTLEKGQALHHRDYDTLKQQLFDIVFEAGYLDVHYVRSELRVYVERQQADIVLILETGPRYFFGRITFAPSVIDESLLRQYVMINENTPFNSNDLLKVQLDLMDTGYFRHIEFDVQREHAENHNIPVTIITQAVERMKYSASMGYGTDTGPRLGLGILSRRINRRGHKLNTQLRLSQVEQIFSGFYRMPISTNNLASKQLDFFHVSLTVDQELFNETESLQFNTGIHLYQQRWGGHRHLSLSLIQERFAFDDDEPKETSTLLIPSLKFDYKHNRKEQGKSSSSHWLLTRRGYRLTANIHAGIDSVFSETNFFHTSLSTKSVWPLNDDVRFLHRAELGRIYSDSFDKLPPSQRFFAGGAQSVRGYGYRDISPRNRKNQRIGGDYLVVNSMELDYVFDKPLWGNRWGMAMFFDVGEVTDSIDFHLQKAVGLGFRYQTPIGLIRLDMAHPLDDPDNDIRIHINIGPDL